MQNLGQKGEKGGCHCGQMGCREALAHNVRRQTGKMGAWRRPQLSGKENKVHRGAFNQTHSKKNF